MEIQEQNGVAPSKLVFECTFCKKQLTTKASLKHHYTICKNKNKTSVDTDNPDKLLDNPDKLLDIPDKLDKILDKLDKILDRHDKLLDRQDKILDIPEKLLDIPEKLLDIPEKLLDDEILDNKVTDPFHINIAEYNLGNNLVVPIRSDGMLNATALCKAGNKLIGHYLENRNTKEFLTILESNIGIPILDLIKADIGGNHSGTWVHRKIGYHLAQWISPEFSVKVSTILDELFINGKIELGKETPVHELESTYQHKIKSLQLQLEQKSDEHKSLLIKHNSSLKNHRYVKFKEKGPCFYIIEQGIPCECKYNMSRKKFGIAGLSKEDNQDTIDDRLRSHRTNWPQLKVNYIIFIKEVDVIEQSIKRIYEKEINPNGHEIIEGVSTENIINRINKLIDVLGIKDYRIVSEDKLKQYNDYVVTTVKTSTP